MTDRDFMEAEMDFKDQVEAFVTACRNYGMDPGERIADILVDNNVELPSHDK